MLFKFIPLFLVLTFEITYHYPRLESTEGKLNMNMTQPLKSINLKDKLFHNLIAWSKLNFLVKIYSAQITGSCIYDF